ncbi:MAG: KdsC family phosphatase [Lentisphaeria bacterium]
MKSIDDKAQAITTVILDIDGVLTDGKVGYGESDMEIKFFDVKDGHGLKLLMRAGLTVGLLSGRGSRANRTRAEELGVDFLYEDKKNKRQAFQKLLLDHRLTREECLYIGDDLVDVPVMREAGLSIAVADAVQETKDTADWITTHAGGRGAVREVCDWLLKKQDKWTMVTDRYLQ